jgi:hypothetical protein
LILSELLASDLSGIAGCEEREFKSRRPNRLEENLLGRVGGKINLIMGIVGLSLTVSTE